MTDASPEYRPAPAPPICRQSSGRRRAHRTSPLFIFLHHIFVVRQRQPFQRSSSCRSAHPARGHTFRRISSSASGFSSLRHQGRAGGHTIGQLHKPGFTRVERRSDLRRSATRCTLPAADAFDSNGSTARGHDRTLSRAVTGSRSKA